METKDNIYALIRQWRSFKVTFAEHVIIARAERPPEQRRINANIYLMTEFLRNKLPSLIFDPDYKHASVWCNEGELVRWDLEDESFSWEEEVIQKADLTFDRDQAVAYTARK